MTRPLEQRLRKNAKEREKRAIKAIAAGRVPGRCGTGARFTEEEKREKRRIKSAKWRAENRERSRQITRESMKRASDKSCIARGRKPGQRGPTPIIRTPEEKRARQNTRVKKYYANNIGKMRPYGAVLARNRRAKLKEVGGTHSAEDIAYLRMMQKDKCTFCLQLLGDETPDVDHHLPLALGGTNDRKNLHLLHKTCNRMKSKKHPIVFAQQNGLLCW